MEEVTEGDRILESGWEGWKVGLGTGTGVDVGNGGGGLVFSVCALDLLNLLLARRDFFGEGDGGGLVGLLVSPAFWALEL